MEIEELPYLDEHATEVEAAPEAVWDALRTVVARSFSGTATTAYTRLVGAAAAA